MAPWDTALFLAGEVGHADQVVAMLTKALKKATAMQANLRNRYELALAQEAEVDKDVASGRETGEDEDELPF